MDTLVSGVECCPHITVDMTMLPSNKMLGSSLERSRLALLIMYLIAAYQFSRSVCS